MLYPPEPRHVSSLPLVKLCVSSSTLVRHGAFPCTERWIRLEFGTLPEPHPDRCLFPLGSNFIPTRAGCAGGWASGAGEPTSIEQLDLAGTCLEKKVRGGTTPDEDESDRGLKLH